MNQEPLVEVRSIMTYDNYKKYFFFSLFRRKSYKRYLVLFYVISSIGILASLSFGIFFGFDTVNIILLLTLLVLTLFMSYLVIFAPKNYYKTAKKVMENLTIYKFTPEYLDVESKAEVASFNSSIRYDAFYMIYEMDEVFFLFTSNRQAYLVPKNDIPVEILEQLRTIFKFKLGKKYHNYSNK
jgi:hypothetical protein